MGKIHLRGLTYLDNVILTGVQGEPCTKKRHGDWNVTLSSYNSLK